MPRNRTQTFIRQSFTRTSHACSTRRRSEVRVLYRPLLNHNSGKDLGKQVPGRILGEESREKKCPSCCPQAVDDDLGPGGSNGF